MHIQIRPITFLDIAKLAIYGIFLNYYCYNILRGSFIPMGTQIFFAVAVVCIAVTMIGKEIYLGSEIKCWIAYLIISFLTSFLAASSQYALDGLNKYWQRLVIIALIAYICEHEKSVQFAIRVLAVTAIACAVSCLIKNVDVSQKLTVESGATISTNDIGSIMAFGCFAVLVAFGLKENKSYIKTAIKIGYVIAAISVIFIAGSRKSILAILILFAMVFLLCARDLFKDMSATRFVIVSVLILGAILFVYYYLLPSVESTDMYQRLYGRKAEGTAESDEVRIELYITALMDFAENLLFGLGFNNTSFVHGIYSHSTYVEPLSCSGLCGLLYLAPYVMILVKQINLIKLNNNNQSERVWQKELLAFYISFLFVGIGIPYMYKDIPCIILAMFIASQKISFDKLNEEVSNAIMKGVIRE